MTTPTLEQKALRTAIHQLRGAKSPKEGNDIRNFWNVFKSHPEFKEEVKKKRIEFSKLK